MDQTINEFFQVALEDMNRNGETEILCPCKKCENEVLIDPSTDRVKMHLLKHSFMPGQTRWTRHGEDEEDAEVEGVAHDDEPEGGMKNIEAEHENHLDGQEGRVEVQEAVRNLLYKRQKEQSDKDLSKMEDDLDDQQSGVYQEEGKVQLKTKCTKRSRNTLLDVESSVERIQKRRRS